MPSLLDLVCITAHLGAKEALSSQTGFICTLPGNPGGPQGFSYPRGGRENPDHTGKPRTSVKPGLMSEVHLTIG